MLYKILTTIIILLAVPASAITLSLSSAEGDLSEPQKINLTANGKISGLTCTIKHQNITLQHIESHFDAIRKNKNKHRTAIAAVSVKPIKGELLSLKFRGRYLGSYPVKIETTELHNPRAGYTRKTVLPIAYNSNGLEIGTNTVSGAITFTQDCDPPKINYFRANPNPAPKGSMVTLEWSASNSVILSDGIFGMGSYPAKGTHDLVVDRAKTFFLISKNSCGKVREKLTVRIGDEPKPPPEPEPEPPPDPEPKPEPPPPPEKHTLEYKTGKLLIDMVDGFIEIEDGKEMEFIEQAQAVWDKIEGAIEKLWGMIELEQPKGESE